MKMIQPAALVAATPLGLIPAGEYAKAYPRAIQGCRPRAEGDPGKILAQLAKDFEDFKTEHTAAMKGKADVVAMEKVEKINSSVSELQAALDELNKRIAASNLNGGGGTRAMSAEQVEYQTAFHAFFRSGGDASGLKALAVKAQLTRQSDPDGGYVVSPEIEKEIDRVLGTVSVMRQLATVRTTGASVYKKRVGQGGATSGWVGENEPRTETATPRFSELEFPAMTLYANPEATEEMLEDADFDIAAWLADEINIEFAEEEGAAHITGNGIKKPRGILGYDTVEDSALTWGKIGYKIGGHATLLNDADKLIDLTTSLKQGFRMNASWLMNRPTGGTVRKLKNTAGDYLWQPSLQVGKPATLLGYPTYEDDNMPDVGAGAFPVAFGDFRRGYLILDRRGIRVLRNPYKNEGFVTFYTTKRTGGGVQHFEAIKLLKIAAA